MTPKQLLAKLESGELHRDDVIKKYPRHVVSIVIHVLRNAADVRIPEQALLMAIIEQTVMDLLIVRETQRIVEAELRGTKYKPHVLLSRIKRFQEDEGGCPLEFVASRGGRWTVENCGIDYDYFLDTLRAARLIDDSSATPLA